MLSKRDLVLIRDLFHQLRTCVAASEIDSVVPFLQENAAQVEEIITKIIDQIMNEDFRKTTEISRCEYCDYKAICNR